MAIKLDNLKWNLYLKKKKLLFFYGFKNGLIHPYEKDLIENLRHIYYGGVPASIIIPLISFCNGRCYDRALLLATAFRNEDFCLIDADVDEIRLNPKIINKFKDYNDNHFANHCFVERTKTDGTIWVYDTSVGLVFEKNLYYKLQNPRITKINTKEKTLNYCEFQDILNADIERDKYILPLTFPNIEAAVEKEYLYKELLKEEIERFKKEIDYDGICKEIEEDMKARLYKR